MIRFCFGSNAASENLASADANTWEVLDEAVKSPQEPAVIKEPELALKGKGLPCDLANHNDLVDFFMLS